MAHRYLRFTWRRGHGGGLEVTTSSSGSSSSSRLVVERFAHVLTLTLITTTTTTTTTTTNHESHKCHLDKPIDIHDDREEHEGQVNEEETASK